MDQWRFYGSLWVEFLDGGTQEEPMWIRNEQEMEHEDDAKHRQRVAIGSIVFDRSMTEGASRSWIVTLRVGLRSD